MSICPGHPSRVFGVAICGRWPPGGNDLERRPWRVQPGRRGRSIDVGGGILRDGQNVAGRWLEDHHHRLAPLGVDGVLRGVLHRAVQVIEIAGADCGATSLRMSTSAPF